MVTQTNERMNKRANLHAARDAQIVADLQVESSVRSALEHLAAHSIC